MEHKKQYTLVSLNGADDSGGVERVSFYLKKILEKRGPVTLLTRLPLRMGKLDLVLQPLFMALRLFLRYRHTVVISNSWNSWWFPADFSIHHGTTAGTMERIPELRSRGTKLLAMMERDSARTAKHIVAVSESAKADLCRLYAIPPAKITVLHNFVDETLFFPEPASSHEGIRILFCGRLELRKGLDVLKKLSDYIETLGEKCKYSLCIASNNDDNGGIFSGNTRTAIQTGLRLADMRGFYTSGDVLFFPSRYEGFSMSTLEALACGIPVVGTAESVKDGVAAYDFARVVDLDAPMEEVLRHITEMAVTWRGKQAEIHARVLRDFGSAQYEKKVGDLLDEAGDGHD